MNDIMDFMSHDHDRLDALFRDYQATRTTDLPKARTIFAEFREGLLRHIRWEEELLFPAFESKTGMHGAGPTVVMRAEHRDIQGALNQIANLLGKADPEGVDAFERLLLEVLGPHNDKEEEVLYPWSDRALNEEERCAMVKNMRAETQIKPTPAATRAKPRVRGRT